MNGREIVNWLYKKSGISMVEYGDRLGVSKGVIWDRLNSKRTKDMTVTVLGEMVGAFGYRIVIVQDGARIYGDHYVVE